MSALCTSLDAGTMIVLRFCWAIGQIRRKQRPRRRWLHIGAERRRSPGRIRPEPRYSKLSPSIALNWHAGPGWRCGVYWDLIVSSTRAEASSMPWTGRSVAPFGDRKTRMQRVTGSLVAALERGGVGGHLPASRTRFAGSVRWRARRAGFVVDDHEAVVAVEQVDESFEERGHRPWWRRRSRASAGGTRRA